MIRPKPFLDNFKLRKQAIGNERRLNMTKLILEHAPNFPLTVEYEDIDRSFQKWVEDELNISYGGQRLPTFKLFSNQRISEYAQNWNYLDDNGNLLMNFKTITRENNPKHGENQGNSYNIPGERKYPMFMVPVLQENGQQAYDMYSMKQPFCVDMLYSVNIITNKYELLNMMNQLVLKKFKSINCYINPNNHYMPMTLENVSDESEYNIDDRKYYSQSFLIKIKAYIITEDDYQVTRLPSRVSVRMLGVNDTVKKPRIEIEEDYINNDKCQFPNNNNQYYHQKLKLNITYPLCSNKAEFDADFDMIIDTYDVYNVYDFVLCINGEKQNLDIPPIYIYSGDNVSVEITKDEETNEAKVILSGFNPNVILDKSYNPELSIDENIDEEIIDINA